MRRIGELIQAVEKALQDLSDVGDTGAIKNPARDVWRSMMTVHTVSLATCAEIKTVGMGIVLSTITICARMPMQGKAMQLRGGAEGVQKRIRTGGNTQRIRRNSSRNSHLNWQNSARMCFQILHPEPSPL